MTREEQIAIASCAYGSRGSSIDFTVGAKWADSHPKPAWISVEDDLLIKDLQFCAEQRTDNDGIIAIRSFAEALLSAFEIQANTYKMPEL